MMIVCVCVNMSKSSLGMGLFPFRIAKLGIKNTDEGINLHRCKVLVSCT